MRYHTFFNDYYDRDFQSQMVSTIYEMETGSPMMQSYGKVYRTLFMFMQTHFGKYNWRVFHILAVFILILTGLSLYLTVSVVKNKNAGVYSALFFAFFMNCMSKDFLAFSPEIVFNVFISLSVLCFVFAEFGKLRMLYRLPVYLFSFFFAYLALNVKLHAAFYILTFFGYYVFFKFEKTRHKWFMGIFFFFVGIIGLLGIQGFSVRHAIDFTGSVLKEIMAYIKAYDISFFNTISKFLFVFISMILSQILLWYFFYRYVFNNKNISLVEQKSKKYFLVFAVCSFIPCLVTLRFYPHYFIQLMPVLAIGGGIGLEVFTMGNLSKLDVKYKKRIQTWFMIPAVFFIFYFSIFFVITRVNPDVRLGINSFTPNGVLVDCINWLKKNTHDTDKIAVWGDAVEIYYFARRTPGGLHLWLKPTVNRYFHDKFKRNLAENSGEKFFREFINEMERNRNAYFIDTQPSGYSGFSEFSIQRVPIIANYVNKHYSQVARAGNIIIYKRKDN